MRRSRCQQIYKRAHFWGVIILLGLFISCNGDSDLSGDEVVDVAVERLVSSITITRSDDSVIVAAFRYNKDNSFVALDFDMTSHELEYTSGEIIETIEKRGRTTVRREHEVNSVGFVEAGGEVRRESINGKIFEFTKTYSLVYDEENYISSRYISSYNNSEEPVETESDFEWIGGVLTRKFHSEVGREDLSTVAFTYTDYGNISNLDLNTFITDRHEELLGVCSLVRLTGEGSGELISTAVHRSQMASGFWAETRYRFEYVLDADLYPVEIRRYSTFVYSSLPIASIPMEILDMTYVVKY